jgi:hypothetical protein
MDEETKRHLALSPAAVAVVRQALKEYLLRYSADAEIAREILRVLERREGV